MRFPTTFSLVLLTGIGWGLIAPTTRLAFERDPVVLDGASFTVARGTWTALAWSIPFAILVTRERRAFDRATIVRAIVLGAIWGPGVMGLFALATQHTALSHVVFSVGLTPVAAGLFAILTHGGSIDAPRRASLSLGVAGVALLGLERTTAHASAFCDLCLLAWVVAFGGYATVAVDAMRRLSPLLVTASANAVGGAILAFAGAFVPHWRAAISAVMLHPGVRLPFFGEIVFFAGFAAPLAYAYALRRAPVAAVTGGSQYISIATGTLAAIFIFHEVFGPLTVIAGLLLALSLWLSLMPRRAPVV